MNKFVNDFKVWELFQIQIEWYTVIWGDTNESIDTF